MILVIGIDLAGVETRPSGFCVLDTESMRAETFVVYTDNEIIQETGKVKTNVVAVDAPLSLPKGRKSLEKKSAETADNCRLQLEVLICGDSPFIRLEVNHRDVSHNS